ncbi:hypothetical protein SNE32_18095, partial [Lysobacter sp. D1-1-M9]
NAAAYNSTAVGNSAIVAGEDGTALGSDSVVTADGGTALGQGSIAIGDNSVALGAGSIALRDDSVSVGLAGSERQITNLAAGTMATDAVNFGQLSNVASVLGGGASMAGGVFAPPSYMIQGNS